MPAIVRKQRVSDKKVNMAKELRGNMTPEEAVLWERLRRNGLQGIHFRRQQVIQGYIVDFYCHKAGLIVEIDGKIHDFRQAEDRKREQVLIDKGLRIIRIKNEEVNENIEAVLDKILKAYIS